MKRNTPVDFWKKVDVRGPNDCWEWQWSRNRYGYGQFRYCGKMVASHRFSWELTYGPIPECDTHYGTMCVCHKCDNPKCVNPAHLFIGTAGDNNRDTIAKGRGNRNRGESVWCSKVTDSIVIAIRSIRGKSCREIALEYGMRPQQVHEILRGETWKHLSDEKTIEECRSDLMSRNTKNRRRTVQ